MIPLTAAAIAEIVDGELSPETAPGLTVTAPAVIDSREASQGSLFVALQGEHTDGHAHAQSAIARGAVLALASQPVSVPAVMVADVEVALGVLAREVLRRLRENDRPTVIAITGSVGKTTTKDLTAAALQQWGPTVAPVASFNNEIGLPLTVLRADFETQFLVLEMGASGPGHIAYLTEIAPPDISVVLCVGAAHVGGFGGIEATAAAKAEIVEALGAQGVAVLNGDDSRVRVMADKTNAEAIFFGQDVKARDLVVKAGPVVLDGLGRPSFVLEIAGQRVQVDLKLHGEHQVANALAVASIVQAIVLAGVSPSGLQPKAMYQQLAQILSTTKAKSPFRMEVTERSDGITIINDAYNANPDSMAAALRALVAMGQSGRTWAVLGEMRELGDDAEADHVAIGRMAVRLQVSRLVVVGAGAQAIHDGATHEGTLGDEPMFVETIDEAEALLVSELMDGDVVLVKSSNGAGLAALGARLAAEGEARGAII